MTTQHTPGPWTASLEDVPYAEFDGELTWTVSAEDHWSICILDCSKHVREANARLIAAAPELYAALREMCNVWGGGNADPVYIEGRRALSLVEGLR